MEPLHANPALSELMTLLSEGVSPYHTISFCTEIFKSRGFTPLPLHGRWQPKPGGKYVVNVFDTTLAAFVVGENLSPATFGPDSPAPALRVAAAHTDWPCLMVKPSPELTCGPYAKLNVSVYGGPILNTWLDRPLSLAGKVCLRGKDPFHPTVRFVDFRRPLLTIPNLAIHFNREVNKGTELNPQIDLQPLLSVLDGTMNRDSFFLDLLAKELACKPADILDYQCYLYNCDPPQLLGIQEELLSSPRLDNLTSVHACVQGLLESRLPNGVCACVLYDNEEIGSSTKQGAASPLLERLLEKLFAGLGFDRSQLLDALFNGFLLSMDVAHALHPNKAEKYDPIDRISLNEGVAIKTAVSQAYATDASYISVIEELCLKNQIPFRKFANRADMRGGSTLGSISSCRLSLPTVDVGVPLLAMHSSRELMGSRDAEALVRLAKAFMQQ